MKADARLVGLDDAPFARSDASVPVIGVVTRGPQYVEGVLSTRVAVDGDDATRRVSAMLTRSRFRPLVRAVFLNGVFVGGFNLVDPDALHRELRVPVVAVVRSAPRPERVEAAMRTAIPDPEARWQRVRRLVPVPLPGLRLWATFAGVEPQEAARLVARAVVRGRLPEPLRLAHVIASGVVRGESRGRA